MAHKSKSQRAKASASRQARKEQKAIDEAAALAKAAEPVEEKPKKGFFKKAAKSESTKNAEQAQAQSKKESKDQPKKKSRFAFLKDVKAELKRVTWPSCQDVWRWSLVVVAALLFFGVFVALLDNVIITPVLVAISGLGA